jgi:protein-ribulosamine 3-kinase
MAVSRQFTAYLEQELSALINQQLKLKHVSLVGGGSINAAYCLHTNAGDYMMKRNSKSAYPNMFEHEAEGLTTIGQTKTIAVPEVVSISEFEGDSILILEWIESTKATSKSSETLGRQLAAMHKHTANQFGFSHNNYMGSLPQSNKQYDSWASFFVMERLQPMVSIAASKQLLNSEDIQCFENLYTRLSGLFTEESPALIHGDLWSGNYLIGLAGKPYLIDPAVSYGNREFDIAMTTLFGGFAPEFYTAYHESFPLQQGWQQRLCLWNLYPLLLHLNLFGGSYLEQVRSCLKKYI